MKHSFIDRYSDLRSPIHALDPRTKIICLLLFVLAVVTTPVGTFAPFGLFAVVILSIVVVSGVPALYVFRRSCLVIPFVLLTAAFLPFWSASDQGPSSVDLLGMRIDDQRLVFVGTVAAKGLLSAVAMIVLSSTTRFSSLLKGLEALRIPKVVLLMMSFMYRYLFVAADQAMRMDRAMQSRCSSNGLRRVRALSGMIGALFIRAYERAERVYQCMVSRGFDGEIRDGHLLRLSAADFAFLIVFVGTLVTMRVVFRS